MSKSRATLIFALAALMAAEPAGAAIKLTPQQVVDGALGKGYQARAAELQAQRSYFILERAKGEFDILFKLNPFYEYSEAESLSGTAFPADRTFTVLASLAKKFSSGTTLTLDYQAIRDNATLNSFGQSNRTPDRALEATGLTLRQALWRNIFGYADRLGVEIGETEVEAAKKNRDESLENVALNAMTLFWNAYIAEQSLKSNVAARDKYETLVANVRRKAGFNLSTPGELPRLQAEFEAADQRVKSSSATYLSAIDQLLTAIQLRTKEPIELEVPKDLPPLPKLTPKSLDDLRAAQVAAATYLNAQRNEAGVRSQTNPRFDLVAKARATGVDETTGQASAEMTSGSKPYYFVGIEFEAPIDSSLLRGQRADAAVATQQSEVNLLSLKDNLRDQLASLERAVTANYSIARSMNDVVEHRNRVVRELEIAYRQGRQPLVELIRSYNDLFGAQLDLARATGDYHKSLNNLAAARDELLPSPK